MEGEGSRGKGAGGRTDGQTLPVPTGEGGARARRARPWRRSRAAVPVPPRWFRPRRSRLSANRCWRGRVMDVRASL